MSWHDPGMILDGKTILVAGVGPGLGGEIARLAARDGANVVLGARTAATLETMATELDPSGARVAHQPTDISDADQCRALALLAVERFGRLDGVVAVAAYDSLMGGLAETADDDWRAVLDTNVVGTMHVVAAGAEAMADTGGSVVLIGSQNASLATVPQLAYGASKGALLSAMYHLANELGPRRIRVNTVVPTWMWGPPVQAYVAWQSSTRNVPEADVIAEITSGMPLGEIPADEDVAEAVVFLCSDRARMITGQTLFVNAGEHMP